MRFYTEIGRAEIPLEPRPGDGRYDLYVPGVCRAWRISADVDIIVARHDRSQAGIHAYFDTDSFRD